MQPGLPLLPTEESSSLEKTEVSPTPSPEHPTTPRASEEELDLRASMAQIRADVKKKEVILYVAIIALLILSIIVLVGAMEKP